MVFTIYNSTYRFVLSHLSFNEIIEKVALIFLQILFLSRPRHLLLSVVLSFYQMSFALHWRTSVALFRLQSASEKLSPVCLCGYASVWEENFVECQILAWKFLLVALERLWCIFSGSPWVILRKWPPLNNCAWICINMSLFFGSFCLIHTCS